MKGNFKKSEKGKKEAGYLLRFRFFHGTHTEEQRSEGREDEGRREKSQRFQRRNGINVAAYEGGDER